MPYNEHIYVVGGSRLYSQQEEDVDNLLLALLHLPMLFIPHAMHMKWLQK